MLVPIFNDVDNLSNYKICLKLWCNFGQHYFCHDELAKQQCHRQRPTRPKVGKTTKVGGRACLESEAETCLGRTTSAGCNWTCVQFAASARVCSCQTSSGLRSQVFCSKVTTFMIGTFLFECFLKQKWFQNLCWNSYHINQTNVFPERTLNFQLLWSITINSQQKKKFITISILFEWFKINKSMIA